MKLPDTIKTEHASRLALDLNEYGMQCLRRMKYEAAEIAFRKCIAMHPTHETFWINLSACVLDNNKLDLAVETLKLALALHPNNPKMLNNLGLTYGRQGRYDEAMRTFEKAIKIAPREYSILWNRACIQAVFGHWETISDYEKFRTKQERGVDMFKDCPFPMWDGTGNLNGKTLYVQFDQGYGDRILYSRFLWWVKQNHPACTILASGNERMNALLWGFQQDGVCTLLPEKIAFPIADLGVYATELASFAKIMPDNIPEDPGVIRRYALPMSKAMRKVFPFPLMPAKKVGVCWTGNPTMARNRERSIPPELMLSLAELPNVALYSLQAGAGAGDIDRLGADQLCHNGPGFGGDLEDKSLIYLAATILNLDLVITCCTSIAHLAGALNVPTLLLLCADPYWIWTREGETTNWYPSIKIFRQKKVHEWQPVIEDVKRYLKAEET